MTVTKQSNKFIYENRLVVLLLVWTTEKSSLFTDNFNKVMDHKGIPLMRVF